MLARDRSRPPATRGWSLRRRLLALVLALSALAWGVGGLVVARAVDELATRHRDERLLQLAATVLLFARHELAESGTAGQPSPAPMRHGGPDLRYRYQVFLDGRVLMYSGDAPFDRPLGGTLQPGYVAGQLDGKATRTYVSPMGADRLQVQVTELFEPVDEQARWPGPGMGLTLLLSLLAVAATAGVLVMRAMRPVAAAAESLQQRREDDHAPLPLEGLPDEITPLMRALNRHLEAAAERLSRERGFTALAAHELRTPLAALRMQVQVALRQTDPAARERQLHAAMASVDRSDHLVDQLLTLARIDQIGALQHEPVDLPALLARVADELAPQRVRRQVDVVLDGAPCSVSGWRFGLSVLVRNLVANALEHAPAGTSVQLSWRVDAGVVELLVDDAGPGIASEDHVRVFQRFVRLERPDGSGDTSAIPGVGLGLAIVRAVADAHGARVALDRSPAGGLRVRVWLRAAPAPAGSPHLAP